MQKCWASRVNQGHDPHEQHGTVLKSFRGWIQGRENESQARIRKFMTLMDSMTEKELDENNIKVLQEPSRIERIARGAGRHPNDMLELLGELNRHSLSLFLTRGYFVFTSYIIYIYICFIFGGGGGWGGGLPPALSALRREPGGIPTIFWSSWEGPPVTSSAGRGGGGGGLYAEGRVTSRRT